MELAMTIEYEVTGASPEVEASLEEVVADEARAFSQAVRDRLAAEGVDNVTMRVRESTE